MEAFAESIIAFIEANQGWFPLIMVLFAAAETTAFLSILIPSTPVLAAIGALAATGALSFTSLFVGATVGALIGSTFSYWLGWRYGSTVLKMRPLRDHPEMVEKTQAAFTKYGPATILIGHFTTIFRPVVFLMAGMSGMTFPRFALWNTLGCVAWAYIVPKLGQVGGDLIGWIWSLF
ncbi:DedA family protein [Tabrizicola sp.]|uniref:DedA family protein n=1 Tax=Tabrizicola sp. TaxID=2005166 RepID=UPI001A5B8126|nr:DedA family protein [Tabrizicola sp.]MBL9072499.1 DedA family protein [Tabrizicola sp.]